MARPREFDTEAALVAVMELFWECGFEATSVEDITETTGLSRSSLYQAFGSKRALFDQAIDRYVSSLADMTAPIEHGEPGLDGVLGFFDNWERRVVDGVVDPSLGCFMVNTTTEMAGQHPELFERAAGYRKRLLDAFEAALHRASERGDVVPGDSGERARSLVAAVMGVFVASRGNRDPADVVEWIRAARTIAVTWQVPNAGGD